MPHYACYFPYPILQEISGAAETFLMRTTPPFVFRLLNTGVTPKNHLLIANSNRCSLCCANNSVQLCFDYCRHSAWKSPKNVSFYNIASEASYVYFQLRNIWIFCAKINIWPYMRFSHFWRENSNEQIQKEKKWVWMNFAKMRLFDFFKTLC